MQPTPPTQTVTDTPPAPATTPAPAPAPAPVPAPAPSSPIDAMQRLTNLQPWGYIILGTGYIVALIFVGLLALVHDGSTIQAAMDLFKWVLTGNIASLSAWGAIHSVVNRPSQSSTPTQS